MDESVKRQVSRKYCRRFGEIAIRLGFITEAKLLAAALDCQREDESPGRDSGLAAASKRITVTMREKSPPGFFVAAPVYRSGAPLRTVEERRNAFLGCADRQWSVVYTALPSLTTAVSGKMLPALVMGGIVQRHGGSIDVESEVGLGSRFRVMIPRHRAEEEARTGAEGDIDLKLTESDRHAVA